MSTSLKNPARYKTGEDRYVRFAQELLGVRLSETQKKILRTVATNRRTIIVSGNGVGKSYGVAILADAFVFTNVDSTSFGTSGSYSQFVDTMWRPMSAMAKTLKEQLGLPGKIYEGNQPRIEIDDEWYFKVASPRDPGDLEGRHASDVLVIIEEADKRYITEKHFDSAGSSVTDANDRMVAVANPPVDEANVVYDLMKPESRWEVIQFSSFQSHNVQVDLEEIDDEHIQGLVDLPTIAEDWEAWNDEPWPKAEEQWEDGTYPGVSELIDRVENPDSSFTREELLEVLRPGATRAEYAHEHRTDLDVRWYRRRAGVIPPDNASRHRPFTVNQVEDAYARSADTTTAIPQGAALDVARKGGDKNILSGVYGDELRVIEEWQGVSHTVGRDMIRVYENELHHPVFAVDAQGEGSGLADMIAEFLPEMIRFHAGQEAALSSEFYDKWTEGLYKLGMFLREGSFNNRKLREELLVAARNVEFEERYYKSRDAAVLKATSRDEVKERLGRSPDYLDSAYMAAWAASDAPEGEKKTQLLVW